ncbi:NAD(P)-dependent oxidoreductase [Caballeronia zhejiangensis]|uniref:NAD(P)-dependent oxidoreductase n=1 Tax=Caballeronia zhejiangensis TaxID=871203 RepID=UPI0023B853D4|nr:NAD(P)-dependent oxidoreductase [Caballeronia zhejiangensis]
MIRSVALIGAGAMGAPMARRILHAGFELTVCDRNRTALASLAQAGANVTTSPSECGGADMIVVVVATAAQMLDVVLGERGIGSGLGSAQGPLLAIMSTVSNDAMQQVRRALVPKGVRVLDAPVSGGVIRAQQGSLTIMTSGEAVDIDAARPVFETMGNRLFTCGGPGAAMTMKIVNNILGVANAVIAGEAYRLAEENGLDLVDTARVLDVSTGRNFMSANPEGVRAAYASMVPDREAFASLLSIMRKDIGLAADLTSGSPGAYPAIAGLMSIVGSIGDETFATWTRLGDL